MAIMTAMQPVAMLTSTLIVPLNWPSNLDQPQLHVKVPACISTQTFTVAEAHMAHPPHARAVAGPKITRLYSNNHAQMLTVTHMMTKAVPLPVMAIPRLIMTLFSALK